MRRKLQNENCKLQIANLSARRGPLFNLRFSIFNFQFAILLLAAPLFAAEKAGAKLQPPGPESWPTFRNGNQQLGVATTKLPEKIEKLWSHEAGAKDGMIKSTAAIAGGRVYAASLNGEVFCLDLKTGNRLWTYKSQEQLNPNIFIPGFKAAVAVTAEGRSAATIVCVSQWLHGV